MKNSIKSLISVCLIFVLTGCGNSNTEEAVQAESDMTSAAATDFSQELISSELTSVMTSASLTGANAGETEVTPVTTKVTSAVSTDAPVKTSAVSVKSETPQSVTEKDSKITGRIITSGDFDLSGIKIDIFSSQLDSQEDGVEIYAHTYQYSVYTGKDGYYSFDMPSGKYLVSADMKSLPEDALIASGSYFLSPGDEIPPMELIKKFPWEDIYGEDDIVIAEEETPDAASAAREAEISKYATLFKDERDKKKYIIISVTPENIYWNKLELDITENEPADIFIPIELYDAVKEAEELILWFKDDDSRERRLNIDEYDSFNILRGLKISYNGTYNWNADRMHTIKNNSLYFYDSPSDEIKLDSYLLNGGFMSYPYNHKGEELLFREGMTAEEADEYFLAVYNDQIEFLEEIKKLEEQGIYTEFEPSEWNFLLSGTRFRAKINRIY